MHLVGRHRAQGPGGGYVEGPAIPEAIRAQRTTPSA
jgi:hypothetical protein